MGYSDSMLLICDYWQVCLVRLGRMAEDFSCRRSRSGRNVGASAVGLHSFFAFCQLCAHHKLCDWCLGHVN